MSNNHPLDPNDSGTLTLASADTDNLHNDDPKSLTKILSQDIPPCPLFPEALRQKTLQTRSQTAPIAAPVAKCARRRVLGFCSRTAITYRAGRRTEVKWMMTTTTTTTTREIYSRSQRRGISPPAELQDQQPLFHQFHPFFVPGWSLGPHS